MADDKSNVIDIRDRLPPLVFGDNEVGRVAAKLFSVITNDPERPAVHLAALILTSITLQRVLKEGYGMSEAAMDLLRSDALDLAEKLQVNISFKNKPGE